MEKKEREELVFESLKLKVGEDLARELSAKCAELIEEMKDKVVSFKFLKSDGTIRDAVGTVCQELIPLVHTEDTEAKSKRERTPNYGVVNYYDTEKQSWRCFKAENIISFEKGGDK